MDTYSIKKTCPRCKKIRNVDATKDELLASLNGADDTAEPHIVVVVDGVEVLNASGHCDLCIPIIDNLVAQLGKPRKVERPKKAAKKPAMATSPKKRAAAKQTA